MARDPKKHPGIENEPFFQNRREDVDRRAEDADDLGEEAVRAGTVGDYGDERSHLHALGDEPALQDRDLDPSIADGFADIYDSRRAQTPVHLRWGALLFAMMIAGPFAILGAFMNGGGSWISIFAVCVLGPMTEEMLKASAALYLAEQKPWLVPASWTLILVCAVSGLMFAMIENIVYLNVYIRNPEASIVVWRWTVCTALHVGCSTVAGVGVARIWRKMHRTKTPPQIALASPFLITAIVIHALYNFAVTVLEASGLAF